MQRSVLVIDDDAEFRGLACRVLTPGAIEVVGEAATVGEALTTVERLRPDALLVDIGLPDGDGIELAARLAQLPVAAARAADLHRRRRRRRRRPSRRLGIAGFVPKSELPGPAAQRLLEGGARMSEDRPLRVVIGEDDVLMREGIARLLAEAGCDVVAQAGDAEDLVRKTLAHKPDVAVVDVQMPPHHADDGLRRGAHDPRAPAAAPACWCSRSSTRSRSRWTCSATAPTASATCSRSASATSRPSSTRVRRVASGGSALDPEVVRRMVARRDSHGPIATLTPREREVLEEMAAGKTNLGIAEALCVSEATVEKHVRNIFQKLGLDQSTTRAPACARRAHLPAQRRPGSPEPVDTPV